MLEKLYQDVWTQVYAATWAGLREAARIGEINPVMQGVTAQAEADRAAEAALAAWDPAKSHAAVGAAEGLRKLNPNEQWGPEADAPEGT